jgi:hypothetical protein
MQAGIDVLGHVAVEQLEQCCAVQGVTVTIREQFGIDRDQLDNKRI